MKSIFKEHDALAPFCRNNNALIRILDDTLTNIESEGKDLCLIVEPLEGGHADFLRTNSSVFSKEETYQLVYPSGARPDAIRQGYPSSLSDCHFKIQMVCNSKMVSKDTTPSAVRTSKLH